jgi:hypothetical protein
MDEFNLILLYHIKQGSEKMNGEFNKPINGVLFQKGDFLRKISESLR